MLLVAVIAGPIASGKSSLSRAAAARLQSAGKADVAVIDLDLVYEMLDPRNGPGRPKNDEALWSHSRRVAGRLARVFLSDGRVVVAEGNFTSTQALNEFERELPTGVRMRLVMLHLDFDSALQRAQGDNDRGLLKDASFLSAHYSEFSHGWQAREVLHLDTRSMSLAEAADEIVVWLGAAG